MRSRPHVAGALRRDRVHDLVARSTYATRGSAATAAAAPGETSSGEALERVLVHVGDGAPWAVASRRAVPGTWILHSVLEDDDVGPRHRILGGAELSGNHGQSRGETDEQRENETTHCTPP